MSNIVRVRGEQKSPDEPFLKLFARFKRAMQKAGNPWPKGRRPRGARGVQAKPDDE